MIAYNVLRELILAVSGESFGALILNSGLSDNPSLEKFYLGSAFVHNQGSETFRALCESLRGNMTLRYLHVSENAVILDGVCVTALRLDTMSLETFDLDYSSVTSCGIAAFAQSLQGLCTLKELILFFCDLDDTGLLKLGEALTSYVSLEVLGVRGRVFTHNGACRFFEPPPQMKGLETLDGLVVLDGFR